MSTEAPDPPVEPETVAAEDLARRIAVGDPVRLLDVRDRDEHESWAVEGPAVTATQVPLAKFLQARVTDSVPDLAADLPGEGPLTVVCARGEASGFVAGLLADVGVDARNLDGGMEAWARVYLAEEVDCEGATLLQYRRPATGCLGYLVVADGEAAVVDPIRAFADHYSADAAARDATLRYAVDTHVHADHVSGVRQVAAESDAEAVLPARAAERGVEFDARTVADGETLPLGEAGLRAVALPGHTTGMTGFAVGDALLTGDSLFVESVARPDLQGDADDAAAQAEELYRTLTDRLAAFGDETLIAPGHYGGRARPASDGTYTARLGDLRDCLWAFDADREAFLERVTSDLPPRPANAGRIVAANLGRESLDDAAAFEAELGPNNCAVGSGE